MSGTTGESSEPSNQPTPAPRPLVEPSVAAPVRVLPCAPIDSIAPLSIERRWLVEDLWVAQGVGLLGGPPKAGKSWLALDIALSVASGTPALGTFAVPNPGTVLLFPAEDGPAAIRTRVDGLARSRGLTLAGLPLIIITADILRLDDDSDRRALEQLIETHQPRLLVLDPLVRLHSGDENHAGHVSALLLFLRQLQRRFGVAIIVAHHVGKKKGGHPGESLRGSGDLHAWGDSNAYLQRRKDGAVLLTLEHRFAPSPDPLVLKLKTLDGGGARFEILADANGDEEEGGGAAPRYLARNNPNPSLLTERVVTLLQATGRPMSQVKIRKALRVRNAELTAALRTLQVNGQLESLGRMGGWRLTPADQRAADQPTG